MKTTTFTKKDKQYSLIGMRESEAKNILQKDKIKCRVCGENDMMLMDYIDDRISLIVDSKNLVVDAYIG